MENKETTTTVEKKESVLKPSPGTKVCIISKKELEELKRTNKLKQTDPTKSPNVFLIKQQLCDKLRTSEPNKKFVLKHVVRTKSTEGTAEKKPVFQIVQKPTGVATTSTIEVKKEDESVKEAQTEQKKGVIFKTKIISNSKVKLTDADIKKIFTNKTPNILKRVKLETDDDVKFKPNGRPAKTYLRNPDAANYTGSVYDEEAADATPVKRKRGRPRKNDSNRKTVDDDASTDDEDWSPNKTTTKKRKRGHRKKVYDDEEDDEDMWSSYQEEDEDEEEDDEKSSAVEDEESHVKSSTEEDKPKRKRGRPPKPPVAEEAENKSQSEVIKSEDNSPSPPKVPKKRGRPRKNPQPPSPQPDDEEEDEKAKSEDVSSADETLPVTRRRSRKNINYFELANPKSFDEWADEKRQAEKNEKSEQVKDMKKTTKVTKIVITEKRVTPDYVEIGFCTKDLNEQDHQIVQQEKNKPDEERGSDETTDETVDSKEKSVKVIKTSEDGKSGENGEVIYVIQQIDNNDVEKTDDDQNNVQEENNQKEIEEETEIVAKNEIDKDSQEKHPEKVEEEEKQDSDESKDKKPGTTSAVVGTLFDLYKKETVGAESTTTTTSNCISSDGTALNSNVCEIVKCQTCNQELELSLWFNHNKFLHNFLSWHSKETGPDLTNSNIVTDLIEPLFIEKRFLKCDKCPLKFENARLFTDHWMTCKGTNAPTTTCAVCQMIMPTKSWKIHKHKQHNNLAWQVGEPALDLSNKSVVMGILNALYKSKKPLYCEKCGSSKKSVLGYLSHRSTCMKSNEEKEDLKVQCPHCPAKILPVSMSYHLNTVHFRSEKKPNPVAKEEFNPNSKRSAAKKALSMINRISGELEDNKYYASNVNFSEADFIHNKLDEELQDKSNLSCKFKDCSFVCNTTEEFITHSNTCQLKPSTYFICKQCLIIVSTEEQIKKHVKNEHRANLRDKDEEFAIDEAEVEIEDYYDRKRAILLEKSKVENDLKYKRTDLPKPQFILNISKSKKPNELFPYALSWMTDFCQVNYSNPLLFENYRVPINNWSLMDVNNIKSYLPPLTQSCDIAFTTVKGFENCLNRDYNLRKLDLFENCLSDNGDCFIFCGGAITALSWLPTPHTSEISAQILAVSTLSDPNLNCVTNQVYNEKTVIQFWDFSTIQNKKPINIDPRLLFGICVDYGPIWHLEWCPSGCYDEEIRLGLLAAAASDGFVYIYSIPVLKDAQNGLFYKNKIVARLQLDVNEKPTNYYATRISWSKVSGHSFIACGYSNGIVALYDFNNDSQLLKPNKMNVLPYKRFIAHAHYISVLSLLHLNNGNRWLLTGSFDKYMNVWDLESGMKISSSKKNIVGDGGWLTHWLAYLTNSEESSCLHPIHSTVTNVRNFLSDSTHINLSLSSLRSVSYSDWLNLIINGNSCGEMFCFLGHQFLHCTDSDKMMKYSKYLLGYVTMVEKNKTPEERCIEEELKEKALRNTLKTCTQVETNTKVTHLDYNPHYYKYEPVNYLQTCEKYGLVFCDSKLNSFSDFPIDMADQLGNNGVKYHILKPNLYALQAINKIAVNPNKYSSTFFAVGYQAGFLRVSCMKFVNNDRQVA